MKNAGRTGHTQTASPWCDSADVVSDALVVGRYCYTLSIECGQQPVRLDSDESDLYLELRISVLFQHENPRDYLYPTWLRLCFREADSIFPSQADM